MTAPAPPVPIPSPTLLPATANWPAAGLRELRPLFSLYDMKKLGIFTHRYRASKAFRSRRAESFPYCSLSKVGVPTFKFSPDHAEGVATVFELYPCSIRRLAIKYLSMPRITVESNWNNGSKILKSALSGHCLIAEFRWNYRTEYPSEPSSTPTMSADTWIFMWRQRMTC